MKQLLYAFCWLAVITLAKSTTVDSNEEFVEDVMAKYASSFSEDLKNVPQPMLREVLRNTLPRVQRRLVEYVRKWKGRGRG